MTADSPAIAPTRALAGPESAQPLPLPCDRYPECRRECLWPDCATGGAQ